MSFRIEIARAIDAVRHRSQMVAGTRWQSVDVSTKPELVTHEVLNHTVKAAVQTENLDVLRKDIEPNLPWADDHFEERVGGTFNPGQTWKTWPYAHSADKFRTAGGGKYSHTYGERYWPRNAYREARNDADGLDAPMGIRYLMGDLDDVVHHLVKDPLSRQAFIPIFFPEDTGKIDVRVPCTLGYHLIMRNDYLHMTYYIRSCDIVRHFRDDIYLTVRLQLWFLNELRKSDERWRDVRPGLFTMHIVSLHCFRNDYLRLMARKE